jgi:hypothetical protein
VSRWSIKVTQLDEHENGCTAVFTCTEVDMNRSVVVTLSQKRGEPAADLVGALRALAQLMVRASGSDEELPGMRVERLN